MGVGIVLLKIYFFVIGLLCRNFIEFDCFVGEMFEVGVLCFDVVVFFVYIWMCDIEVYKVECFVIGDGGNVGSEFVIDKVVDKFLWIGGKEGFSILWRWVLVFLCCLFD